MLLYKNVNALPLKTKCLSSQFDELKRVFLFLNFIALFKKLAVTHTGPFPFVHWIFRSPVKD